MTKSSIDKQRLACRALLGLACLTALSVIVNVLAGNLLGLITNAASTGTLLITYAAMGRNIKLAEDNAELRLLLSPSEKRERDLRIAKLERELGVGQG